MRVFDEVSCFRFVSGTCIVAGFEYLLGCETFEDLWHRYVRVRKDEVKATVEFILSLKR